MAVDGRFPNDGSELHPPWKDNHMKGFDEALKDALKNWNGEDGPPVGVSLSVKVSPNPGGVKEYHAKIGG
jgi:hypothetical protein